MQFFNWDLKIIWKKLTPGRYSVKQKSQLKKTASQWEEKIKHIAEKREQKMMENPPGVANLDEMPISIEPIEQPIKSQDFDEPVQELVTSGPPSIVESTSSRENRKPRKPVKFSRRRRFLGRTHFCTTNLGIW